MGRRLAGGIPAVIGGFSALLATAYGWWGGVRSAGGSAVVLSAALLATLGLAIVVLGIIRDSPLLEGIGMVAVGITAPTGFGYVFNLAALVCGVILLIGSWRGAHSRSPGIHSG